MADILWKGVVALMSASSGLAWALKDSGSLQARAAITDQGVGEWALNSELEVGEGRRGMAGHAERKSMDPGPERPPI